jgi:hypothetical protein
MEIAWVLVPWDRLYAVEFSAALTWYGADAKLDFGVLIIAGKLISVLYIISSLGLLLFRNWARHLFLSLVVMRLTIALMAGIAVQSPIEATLGYIFAVLEGAVIAMLYSSDTANKFAKMTPQPAGH